MLAVHNDMQKRLSYNVIYHKICELHLDTNKYYLLHEMYVHFVLMTLIYYEEEKK
jgi:hypothetical protein